MPLPKRSKMPPIQSEPKPTYADDTVYDDDNYTDYEDDFEPIPEYELTNSHNEGFSDIDYTSDNTDYEEEESNERVLSDYEKEMLGYNNGSSNDDEEYEEEEPISSLEKLRKKKNKKTKPTKNKKHKGGSSVKKIATVVITTLIVLTLLFKARYWFSKGEKFDLSKQQNSKGTAEEQISLKDIKIPLEYSINFPEITITPKEDLDGSLYLVYQNKDNGNMVVCSTVEDSYSKSVSKTETLSCEGTDKLDSNYKIVLEVFTND